MIGMRATAVFRFLLLAALPSSTLSMCESPSPCMGPYEPVCASDDMTYFNACAFQVAQCKQPQPSDLEILASGVCCPLACPPLDVTTTQVCGSDGETYDSPCEFLRARCDGAKVTLRIVADGPCAAGVDCSGLNCDAQGDNPVCGSDDRTYANLCELARAQCLLGDRDALTLSYEGPCIAGVTTDSDSVTTLPAAGTLSILVPSDINKPTSPNETNSASKCPTPAFEICASDGVTYDTVCAFTSARHTNPLVQFASLGSCQDDPPRDAPETGVNQCDFMCPAPRVYEPVCTAETGIVFVNKCAYVAALCRDLALPPARPEYCDPLVLPPAVGDFA